MDKNTKEAKKGSLSVSVHLSLSSGAEMMVPMVVYGESLPALDPLSSNLFPIFMVLHKRERW